MKIKVGIVGTGVVAQWMHIPYIKSIDKYDLVAACDVSSKLVKTVGKVFNIPKTYIDYENMLQKEALDAIIVCTPNECHEVVCLAAFEASCNVLVEKPLALSVKSADRIVKASEKAGRKLMVAYMKRYDPGYEKGSEMIKSIEDVFFIRVHDFANGIISDSTSSLVRVMREETKDGKLTLDNQKESKEMTRKYLHEQLGDYSEEIKADAWKNLLALGSHDMTVLRGAFGDPEKILATTIIPGLRSEISAETDYTTKIFSLLDYGKARCSFELGGTQRTWFDEELAAFGNKQTISIKWPFPWLKNDPTTIETTSIKNGGYEHSKIACSFEESFRREHLHFINCIEKDLKPKTNGTEGKRDMEILSSILEKADLKSFS